MSTLIQDRFFPIYTQPGKGKVKHSYVSIAIRPLIWNISSIEMPPIDIDNEGFIQNHFF